MWLWHLPLWWYVCTMCMLIRDVNLVVFLESISNQVMGVLLDFTICFVEYSGSEFVLSSIQVQMRNLWRFGDVLEWFQNAESLSVITRLWFWILGSNEYLVCLCHLDVTRFYPESIHIFPSLRLNDISDFTNGQTDPRRWVGSGYFARRCQVA